LISIEKTSAIVTVGGVFFLFYSVLISQGFDFVEICALYLYLFGYHKWNSSFKSAEE